MAAALADPVLATTLPDELRAYLAAIRRPPPSATSALRAQLDAVATALNEIDIVPVALKGAIRLVDGLWPDPALRFMHDLDLLVPTASWRGQRARGLAAAAGGARRRPPCRADPSRRRGPARAAPASCRPRTTCSCRRCASWPRTAGPIGDATLAIPALEDQLVHLVAHGMVHHAFLYNGRFLLRDLVEQALLARAGRSARPAPGARAVRARGPARPGTSVRRSWLAASPAAPAPRRSMRHRLLVDRMLVQQRSPDHGAARAGRLGDRAALGRAVAKPAPVRGARRQRCRPSADVPPQDEVVTRRARPARPAKAGPRPGLLARAPRLAEPWFAPSSRPTR